MIKKIIILSLFMLNYLMYSMREDDISQNNETIELNRPEEMREISIQSSDSDTPELLEIPMTCAERIPLIKFLPPSEILKIPYSKKIVENIIDIVKNCTFLDDDEEMKKAFNYYRKMIKKNSENKALKSNPLLNITKQKGVLEIKKIREQMIEKNQESKIKKHMSYKEQLLYLEEIYKYYQNQDKTLDRKVIQYNHNIMIIENIFKQKQLSDRIETLFLADYLNLPSTLIDDIIYGLNLKTMTYKEFIEMKQYANNSICERIKKKRIFLQKHYSAQTLKLSFSENQTGSLAFDPNKKIIALALDGDALNLWHYEKDKAVKTIKLPKNSIGLNLVFNPQGTMMATKIKRGDTGTMIMLWDTEKMTIKCQFKKDTVKCNDGNMTFSEDGKYLYSINREKTNTGSFTEIDTDSCKITKRIEEQTSLYDYDNDDSDDDRINENEEFLQIAYLLNQPNKSTIVVGTNCRLFFYNKEKNFSSIKILTGQKHMNALKFNASSKVVASASADGTIKVWDVTTYKNICTLKGHEDSVTDIAFSPDGKILFSISADKTLKFWNTETAVCTNTLEFDEPLTGLAINNEGTLLCTVDANARVSMISLDVVEELSLKQLLFIMYFQEKKGTVNKKYKEVYDNLPDTIKEQINKPAWFTVKKEEKTDTLKLFPFEKNKK